MAHTETGDAACERGSDAFSELAFPAVAITVMRPCSSGMDKVMCSRTSNATWPRRSTINKSAFAGSLSRSIRSANFARLWCRWEEASRHRCFEHCLRINLFLQTTQITVYNRRIRRTVLFLAASNIFYLPNLDWTLISFRDVFIGTFFILNV